MPESASTIQNLCQTEGLADVTSGRNKQRIRTDLIEFGSRKRWKLG